MMIEEIKCRVAEAREVWDGYDGEYPQSGPADGWLGFLLRLKCSICILLGRRVADYDFDQVPVWVGPMFVGHNWDGPAADWSEVSVGYGWRNWHYARYRNGV